MKLSCIVPTLNEEINVKNFLDKYLKQTEKFHELIFVDGNSRDKTREIIKEYIKENSEIKLIVCDKKGLPAARNCGVDNATGDYITTMDVDWNFLNSFCIKKIYSKIIGEDDVYFLKINYDNNQIPSKLINKYLFLSEIDSLLLFVKREICPRWDEDLGSGEDHTFYDDCKKFNPKIIISTDNEIFLDKRQGDFSLNNLIRRTMWYGRTTPIWIIKRKKIKFALYTLFSYLTLFVLPFCYGFYLGLKKNNLKWGLDVPFGIGFIKVIGQIGKGIGFLQYLFGIRYISRDKIQ